MPTFAELGLSKSTLEALAHLGYERPTPIQEQTIPLLLDGRDVIGQAQTGTGKTAAFGLPMVDYIDPEDPSVQAIVLTPTRELCIQVTQALRAYGAAAAGWTWWRSSAAPRSASRPSRLGQGAQVVVGTVGRVLDMINRHHLILDSARYVILDEADEMLDLGFLEDVETILRRCPMGRQTALFSATVPTEIRRLADTFMHDPVEIQVRGGHAHHRHRGAVLPRGRGPREAGGAHRGCSARSARGQAIVFARTKIGVDRLARRLGDSGVRVKALHGDMSQGQRDGVMIAFKSGRERLLVATDVAARGLDLTGVSHVINYDVPNSPDVYVHRIGRTGRAGESGRAVTLITPKQRRELEAIERNAKIEIEEWSPDGAKQAAPKREDRPARETRRPRHTKPHERDGALSKLVVGAGRSDGLEPADVVGAVVDNTRLENADVRNVRVLERFSFVEVPEGRAAEVAEKVTGKLVRGTELRVEVAKRR